MKKTLVLGIGNLLMTDDALGVRIVQQLQKEFAFSSSVEVVDGGTLGLDLLPMLEDIDRLLIIDALEMDAEPGTVFRMEGAEVPRVLATKVSIHQMGGQDLLALAELRGHLPQELVIIGAQAAVVEMGLEFSPPMAAAVPEVLDSVRRQLTAWGEEMRPAA